MTSKLTLDDFGKLLKPVPGTGGMTHGNDQIVQLQFNDRELKVTPPEKWYVTYAIRNSTESFKNDRTRDLFKSEIMRLYPNGVPQAVKDAMKWDKFDHQGRPLTIRRIKATLKAIQDEPARARDEIGMKFDEARYARRVDPSKIRQAGLFAIRSIRQSILPYGHDLDVEPMLKELEKAFGSDDLWNLADGDAGEKIGKLRSLYARLAEFVRTNRESVDNAKPGTHLILDLLEKIEQGLLPVFLKDDGVKDDDLRSVLRQQDEQHVLRPRLPKVGPSKFSVNAIKMRSFDKVEAEKFGSGSVKGSLYAILAKYGKCDASSSSSAQVSQNKRDDLLDLLDLLSELQGRRDPINCDNEEDIPMLNIGAEQIKNQAENNAEKAIVTKLEAGIRSSVMEIRDAKERGYQMEARLQEMFDSEVVGKSVKENRSHEMISCVLDNIWNEWKDKGKDEVDPLLKPHELRDEDLAQDFKLTFGENFLPMLRQAVGDRPTGIEKRFVNAVFAAFYLPPAFRVV